MVHRDTLIQIKSYIKSIGPSPERGEGRLGVAPPRPEPRPMDFMCVVICMGILLCTLYTRVPWIHEPLKTSFFIHPSPPGQEGFSI